MSFPHRFLVLAGFALLLPACGSVSIEGDGLEGFSPSSEVWLVESSGGADRHSLLLTSISGYCSKRRQAEQDRIDADARHQERLDGGAGICESEDQRLDDLAAAYSALEGDGVASLTVTVDREDESTINGRTAPEEGEYHQVGGAVDGRFIGQYLRLSGKYQESFAEAYSCLDPDSVDETNFNEFLTEVQPDLIDSWEVSAGILELSRRNDDTWDVDVSGDLLSGSNTVGTVEASFAAARCEVPVGELPE